MIAVTQEQQQVKRQPQPFTRFAQMPGTYENQIRKIQKSRSRSVPPARMGGVWKRGTQAVCSVTADGAVTAPVIAGSSLNAAVLSSGLSADWCSLCSLKQMCLSVQHPFFIGFFAFLQQQPLCFVPANEIPLSLFAQK